MRKLSIYPVLVLGLLLSVSCSGSRKIIPESRMAEIYADMFLEDQWLSTFSKYRAMADTTLFYDPVFEMHGVDFEEFSRSVDFYVDHPERYLKVLRKTSELLEERKKPFDEAWEKEKQYNLTVVNAKYKRKDFVLDSLMVNSPGLLWHPLPEKKDSLLTDQDNVAGKDSLRTNQEQTFRKLSGPESLTRKREIMQF